MQILPSGQGPADRATGLVLAPFRGVRYVEDRVSGLAEVTSPPYDVIASDNEDQLLAADPHNVVRMIRPRQSGASRATRTTTRRLLRQWQDDGVLVPDPEPALYVYEQSSGQAAAGPAVQRGLIGAVGLVPREAGIVHPHEAVAPGPVAGRRQLMEATRANLEPIFLLYDPGDDAGPAPAPGRGDRPAPAAAGAGQDRGRHPAPALGHHRSRRAGRDRRRPGSRPALIADGHHRYAAYLELQRGVRRRGTGRALGLRPGPAGRLRPPTRRGSAPSTGSSRLAPAGPPAGRGAFSVREMAGGTRLPAVLDELAAASSDGVAFLVAGGEQPTC